MSTQIFETHQSSNFIPSNRHANFKITAFASATIRNVSLSNAFSKRDEGVKFIAIGKNITWLINDLKDSIDSILLT